MLDLRTEHFMDRGSLKRRALRLQLAGWLVQFCESGMNWESVDLRHGNTKISLRWDVHQKPLAAGKVA